VSAPFLVLNRNKRSLALDLKHPKGVETLKRLTLQSDVLTENYRMGTMEKLGIGYADLKKIHPGLIYATVSGYGRTGPLAEKPGFDLIAQGFSGLMSITGFAGQAPAKTGNPVADINAGILVCLGILAALIHKAKTGEGQLVETSLMEAAMQQTYWQAAMFFATGLSAGPLGSAHPLTAPYQAFKTNAIQLKDAKFVRENTSYPGLRVYEFNRRGNLLLVAWKIGDGEQSMTLPATPAAVTDTFGNVVAPSQTINVTLRPVYIELAIPVN
jgi:crotonobetainyl-CoA:carnitine CoA-transferase CaiB-like acyl-CoA transferase